MSNYFNEYVKIQGEISRISCDDVDCDIIIQNIQNGNNNQISSNSVSFQYPSIAPGVNGSPGVNGPSGINALPGINGIAVNGLPGINASPSVNASFNIQREISNNNFNSNNSNINNLEKLSLTIIPKHLENFIKKNYQKECPVCLEEFSTIKEENIIIRKCGHVFCKSCNDKLQKCEVCRQ